MSHPRIVHIEWARLSGRRPRKAGGNARLGEHGQQVHAPIARVTTDDATVGFGWSMISPERARKIAGSCLGDIFEPGDRPNGVGKLRKAYRVLEYPLFDLVARRAGRPVYALIGDGVKEPFRVPCYDTSLYMDDLHLPDHGEAAALIASEAAEGYARGHRAFKIKVGRGAMHMPLEAGTRRDVQVVLAVREAVGAECRIMLDANNGYNLNLTKRVLAETSGARVYWMEEPFHEDAKLYAQLKEWIAREGLTTLIADGEGRAHPQLIDWAREGLVDVLQYDVRRPGFSRWLGLGPQLDAWRVRSAPHHYGGFYGNYAASHLAAAIRRFEMVEWDESSVDGLDSSAYAIAEGRVQVPALPGFGLQLDDEVFCRAVADSGFSVEAD